MANHTDGARTATGSVVSHWPRRAGRAPVSIATRSAGCASTRRPVRRRHVRAGQQFIERIPIRALTWYDRKRHIADASGATATFRPPPAASRGGARIRSAASVNASSKASRRHGDETSHRRTAPPARQLSGACRPQLSRREPGDVGAVEGSSRTLSWLISAGRWRVESGLMCRRRHAVSAVSSMRASRLARTARP